MAAADQALLYLTYTPTIVLSAYHLLNLSIRLRPSLFPSHSTYLTERTPTNLKSSPLLPATDLLLGLALLYPGLSRRIASAATLVLFAGVFVRRATKGRDATTDGLVAGLALVNLVLALLFPIFGPGMHHDYHGPQYAGRPVDKYGVGEGGGV